VLDTKPHETVITRPTSFIEEESQEVVKITSQMPPAQIQKITMSSLINESEIIIWDKPVDTAEVLEKLVKSACNNGLACDFTTGLVSVRERENQGSTFYSEGVALPHARIAGLDKPLVALGLTRMGVSDVATEKPIKYVFLSFSPLEKPEVQVQLLSLAARTFQNRYFLKSVELANDPQQVYSAIKEWDQSV
jgi:two-component system sensor histidine kinase KdpD